MRVIQEHFPLGIAAGEQAEVAVHGEAHEPHLAVRQGEGLHIMIKGLGLSTCPAGGRSAQHDLGFRVKYMSGRGKVCTA